jgi:hypothetical protein
LETLRLETCELVADWGRLSLSEPVTIRLQDGSVEQSAVLRAVLDLSKQAFVEVSGQVEARLTVAPSFQGGPDLRFELSAKDLGYQSYQVDRVELSGRLQGDALSIDRMAILPLAGADEQVIELSGKANLASRELMLDYNLLLSADWVNRQVGQSIFSESLNTNGRVSGTFERPIVDGKVEPLTLEAPELVPVTLAGNYRSEGVDRFSFDGSATAQGAVINTSLDATLGDEMVTVNLKRLIWSDPERPRLELMAPTQLSYHLSGSADAPENRLLVTPFDLTGPDLQIQGQWDPAVGLELLLRNVSLQRVGRWLERELPEFSIKSVAVSFSELRPKLIGSIGVHLESEAADGVESVHLDLVAQLTATDVTVDPLQLKYANAPLLQGAIAVPMTFRIPAEDKSFWNLLEAGALSGELTGAINPAFSDWLLQNTGV